jgi:hypothetical protein
MATRKRSHWIVLLALAAALSAATAAPAEVVVTMPLPPAPTIQQTPGDTSYGPTRNDAAERDAGAVGRLAMNRYAFARTAPRPNRPVGRPLAFWYSSIPGHGWPSWGGGGHWGHWGHWGWGGCGWWGWGHFHGVWGFPRWGGVHFGGSGRAARLPNSSFRSTPGHSF